MQIECQSKLYSHTLSWWRWSSCWTWRFFWTAWIWAQKKQNELNFTLHWERKKTNISLLRLSKPSIGQHSVDSRLSVVWILVKHQSNFDWDWWASVDMFTVTQLKHIWPIDQYLANTWPTHDYILNQQSANISAMYPFTFRQYRADTWPTYDLSVSLSVISVDRHYLQ